MRISFHGDLLQLIEGLEQFGFQLKHVIFGQQVDFRKIFDIVDQVLENRAVPYMAGRFELLRLVDSSFCRCNNFSGSTRSS